MAISIQVRYSYSQKRENLFCYVLVVEVLAATDVSKKIFVFQRNTPQAMTSATQDPDQFICIADPVDLEEFPEDSPDLAREMPYFRVDKVTLLFRNMEDLEDTKQLIDEDVQILIDSLKAVSAVEDMETKTYE